ncbi:MAG: hypothetical protein MUF84_10935, partial [Anaerolineae bacterium]|nr:hypothetical protein [Anaerolineae bacterium]
VAPPTARRQEGVLSWDRAADYLGRLRAGRRRAAEKVVHAARPWPSGGSGGPPHIGEVFCIWGQGESPDPSTP